MYSITYSSYVIVERLLGLERLVELFDPFRKIAFDPGKLGITDADAVAQTAAVAVGLALRKAGDR